MKTLLPLILLLTGCATQHVSQPTALYRDVLPTYDHVVGYRIAFGRAGVPVAVADRRTKEWVGAMERIIKFNQQNPVRRKTDLVYLGALPAYPLPDTTGGLRTFPPVRFWMTVDNRQDSTSVWLTNFEVAGQRDWQPLEEQSFSRISPEWVTRRLTDLDGMTTALLDDLRARISKP